MTEKDNTLSNFIYTMIDDDNESGRFNGRVHTRFPPEPNGYLHIGHAKAICLNFGIAKDYKGACNLRFDDTNPAKEEEAFVESIKEDVRWLGFSWEDREYYASDYFGKLYDFAIELIREGLAYVDDQSSEEMAAQKGSPTVPGTHSPFRERSVEENLDLFQRMNAGEFPEGSRVLRAKIDMASPNMHMRDPVIYRIIFHPHHRTGDTWKVYPMYDFAHGQSDFFEEVTHSLCTLEFEVHRPLYDWLVEHLKDNDYRPRRTEFNRLNLSYTVLSKRVLLGLVKEGHVNGWDDPRLPTISGIVITLLKLAKSIALLATATFSGVLAFANRRLAATAVTSSLVRKESSVETSRTVAPSMKLKRRPRVSAMTPVGTSKMTMPMEKKALAAKASVLFSPASSRNRVLMPQITEVERVYSPTIIK